MQATKLIVFVFLFFSSCVSAQEINSIMDYKIITSKEGLEYLKRDNKLPKDYSHYETPSGYGWVYELSSGEILLIDPDKEEDGAYPGFVFKDYAAFKKACDADYFPMGKEHMTWLQLRTNEMQNFLKNDGFYIYPLQESLGIIAPFQSYKDCEIGYEKLSAYVKNKKNSIDKKNHLGHCYALAVSKFLIEHKAYDWKLKKNYDGYNPYYYPLISNNQAENIDVLTKLAIAMDKKEHASFRMFLFFVTKIPFNVEIE